MRGARFVCAFLYIFATSFYFLFQVDKFTPLNILVIKI